MYFGLVGEGGGGGGGGENSIENLQNCLYKFPEEAYPALHLWVNIDT